MNEHELLWAMLPDGLEKYFDVKSHEMSKKNFRIVLIEKNNIPERPKEYRGKKIINTIIKSKIIDYFPIRGRKEEIVLKRRYWKFEGIEKLLKREIDINVPMTKLDREFADFLKEFHRE